MSNQFVAFENEVLGLTRTILTQFAESFLEAHLIPDLREIVRSEEGSSKYESEVTVYFWDSEARSQQRYDLVDVVEFHLVHEGRILSSRSEIENWLQEAIRDVLLKRQRSLRGEQNRL